jgi:hypothetical protein
MPVSWRIDFIGVMLNPRGDPPQIDHIPNATTSQSLEALPPSRIYVTIYLP